MEYMVITGHWIDHNWQLQKRVLNFVHIPPPRRGLEIADTIWRCLEDWDIQSKIHTISVDNASANDSAIYHLKTYAQSKKKLLCQGKLFHVRCCAHILNLIAQDGISEIKYIVEVIRDSVEYVRRSDARLLLFSEIVKQLNLPERKLVDDCRTRWNSTYEMLSTAIKFKGCFSKICS
ncbi:UNVERIFIED_CONTAM: Zinc finger BED domain-containing protein RICESLEEPER 2 [Sesamum radiatum]|uniref:Zinc finger BED domain-containing protein RICESLEEPER 2 n=1 Tax=Sesamum radiatum TaxID=300843 RepID=A0AAW2R2X8_SESRA